MAASIQGVVDDGIAKKIDATTGGSWASWFDKAECN